MPLKKLPIKSVQNYSIFLLARIQNLPQASKLALVSQRSYRKTRACTGFCFFWRGDKGGAKPPYFATPSVSPGKGRALPLGKKFLFLASLDAFSDHFLILLQYF